jgi:hypothetical protein
MKKKRWMMVVCVSKNGSIKDDVVKKMKNDDETKESFQEGVEPSMTIFIFSSRPPRIGWLRMIH